MKARKSNIREDNKNWQILFNSQFDNLQGKDSISNLWINGFSRLGINNAIAPTAEYLNEISQKYTKWKFIQTKSNIILDSKSWYKMIFDKTMPLNNFIRTPEELFYCDEPDKWHDIIGHVPFLMMEEYSDMYDNLARLYLEIENTDHDEAKSYVGFIGAYIIELGLIRENGKLKALGATLYSSSGELELAYNPENQEIFTPNNALKASRYDRSQFQGKYFIIESIEQINNFINEIRGTLR